MIYLNVYMFKITAKHNLVCNVHEQKETILYISYHRASQQIKDHHIQYNLTEVMMEIRQRAFRTDRP